MRLFLIGVAALTGVVAGLKAEQPDKCSGPEFRQFDFWLGSWLVRKPDGTVVGTNEISRISGSCAVREQWSGKTGNTGMSLSYYDPTDKKWHQDWVGSDGHILHLEGGLAGNDMVLSHVAGANVDRVAWTPLPDGKVKQVWELSTDGGRTWKSAFIGIYESPTTANAAR